MVNKEAIKQALLAVDPDKVELKALLNHHAEGSAERQAAYDCATDLCYETVMELYEKYESLKKDETTRKENPDAIINKLRISKNNISVILEGHHNKADATDKMVKIAIEKWNEAANFSNFVAMLFLFLKRDERIRLFKAMTEKAITFVSRPYFFPAFVVQARTHSLFLDMDTLIIRARIHRGLREKYATDQIVLAPDDDVDDPIIRSRERENSFSDDTQALLELLLNKTGIFTNDELTESQTIGKEWRLLRGIVAHGQLNLLKVFLQAYPQAIKESLAYKNFEAISTAAGHGHTDIASYILAKYACADSRKEAICAALRAAAFAGQRDTVGRIVRTDISASQAALGNYSKEKKRDQHSLLMEVIFCRMMTNHHEPESIIRMAYPTADVELPKNLDEIENFVWIKYRPIYKTPAAAGVLALLVGAAVGLGLGYGEVNMLEPFDNIHDSHKNEKLAIAGVAFVAAALTALLGAWYVNHETKKALTFRDTLGSSSAKPKDVTNSALR